MRILMVCLGNICRSPMADGWLRYYSNKNQLGIEVDSAGTANYHIGKQPDERMRKWSKTYGVSIDQLQARQFNVSDFDKFDRIFVMDQDNYKDVIQLARNENDRSKVSLYLDEMYPGENREVPDPYYGTDHDFKHVIELLDQTTQVFLKNAGFKLH